MNKLPIVLDNDQIRSLQKNGILELSFPCVEANEANLSYVVDCCDGRFGDEEGDVQFPHPFVPLVETTFYVQEAYRLASWRDDGRVAFDYEASPEVTSTPWIYPTESDFKNITAQGIQECEQKGLIQDDSGCYKWERGNSPCSWQKAESMPLYAARFIVEVSDIRVEDVSQENDLDVFWHWKIKLTLKSAPFMIFYEMTYNYGPDSYRSDFYKRDNQQSRQHFFNQIISYLKNEIAECVILGDLEESIKRYEKELARLHTSENDFIQNGRVDWGHYSSIRVDQRILLEIN